MARQQGVGARAPLPASAFAPLVPVESLPAALASFAVWANSTTNRRNLLRSSKFPIDDLAAFLALNQLIYRGAARPTDLAEALEVSTSHMSKIVARLESAGLAVKAPDPGDRRAVVVALTDEGRAVGSRIVDNIDVYFAELFRDWNEHDRAELSRLMVKLAHSADAVSAQALSRASGYNWSR
ncbi:MarR family transcriptional regulator [Salinibacterium sp. SYSU T00001]|uniref:MarR family winged helix-turn-helix transcriptional regulator n=1 Tax=Homoserinimonas sedimenticola TaxID=2986805 RepID=UPI002235EE2B|nr:MarR family transcriptional regulator [Salinibacterium sedimenticola]MCW4385698.1 MarR family transcriptional regulator [Salinibacterium sedimenticola]